MVLLLQLEKYKNVHYGRCPRAYCCGQPCLPVGTSDIPRTSTVKTYCPKCCDIYYTRNKYQGNIDGAYFGTTFPHLFLMTFSYLKPPKPTQVYTPRIFGFKVCIPAHLPHVYCLQCVLNMLRLPREPADAVLIHRTLSCCSAMCHPCSRFLLCSASNAYSWWWISTVAADRVNQRFNTNVCSAMFSAIW